MSTAEAQDPREWCVWIEIAQDQEIVDDCDKVATTERYTPQGDRWPLCETHAAVFDEQLLQTDMPPGET